MEMSHWILLDGCEVDDSPFKNNNNKQISSKGKLKLPRWEIHFLLLLLLLLLLFQQSQLRGCSAQHSLIKIGGNLCFLMGGLSYRSLSVLLQPLTEPIKDARVGKYMHI